MAIHGSTAVHMEDGSINTIENLYKSGITNFNSIGLDAIGMVVPAEITQLRVAETMVDEIWHIVINHHSDLLGEQYQKVMICNEDGSIAYVSVKDLVANQKLKSALYYIKGNLYNEFISTTAFVTTAFHRKALCNEPVYHFESSTGNLLIPKVTINTHLPLPPFIKCKKNFPIQMEPTSIQYVVIKDDVE